MILSLFNAHQLLQIMASTTPKKYGLIVPPKRKKPVVSNIQKPSVFGDSSSDEEVSVGL